MLLRGLLTILVLLAAIPAALCDSGAALQILLAGDSTMAPKEADKRPETGWGEMLQPWFNERDVRVVNHAKNGRSTRTFISEGRWQALLEQIRPGDFVFIQFGHNDQSVHKVERYTPPGQYRANLERFVGDVRARQGKPVLFTPVVRRRFNEQGNFHDSHGDYPDLVRAVALETHTTLIDMEHSSRAILIDLGEEASKALYLWLEPGQSVNYPEGLQDNTHFTPEGARTMAGLVALDISLSRLGLARFVRAVAPDPGSPAVR
jgi:lysophospholipase L1-like esterase